MASLVDLKGKVAFVTGSGRGLGRAMAERMAELGAAVALHDITQEAPGEFDEAKNLDDVCSQFSDKYGCSTCGVTGDIADEQNVNAMVEKIESTLGPIDVLVNAAGGDIAARGGKPKPNDALGIPLEDVRAIFDRNIIGTMIVCRAVCPRMKERGRGSVINIGSSAAHHPVTDGVAYACAKAAIIHFSWCLAMGLRNHGVRVNTVSPGPTMTARFLVTRQIDPRMTDGSKSLGRYAKPSEIADVVAWLASDASRWISGKVIEAEGGLFLRSLA